MLDHWGVWSAMKSQNTKKEPIDKSKGKENVNGEKIRQNPFACIAPKTLKLKRFSSLPKGWSPITPDASHEQVPVIAVGMQSTQKCWEMLCLFWNKAWFQYDLPKSRCSGIKYGLKMWSGDLFKLKMCSGDRRNVLRRLFPSLKLTQKSPDIRTTVSQNMHQY